MELSFAIAPGTGTNRTIGRYVQFYVHDVELVDAQGRAHRLDLIPEAPWQSAQVALVDLIGPDGTARHARIRGKLARGAGANGGRAGFNGLRFTVGVPFELNHANPLTAEPPLDRGELFWTWQSGYKFMRADVAVDEREWSFHLGSTGCSSASAIRPPSVPCAQPNRVRVALQGDPTRGVIRFQLAPLGAAALAADFAICTGNYAHLVQCAQAYATTGLQLESGECPDAGCAAQRLWALEPQSTPERQ